MDQYHFKKFESILENMYPEVAKRRILELDCNRKLMRVMPFSGDHVSALRRVLVSIAYDDDRPNPTDAAAGLLYRSWPEDAFDVVVDIMQDAASISDDEVRRACHRYMNEGNMKALEKRGPFKPGAMYWGLWNEVNLNFEGSELANFTKSEVIEEYIKNMNLGNENRSNLSREALYFHLIPPSGLNLLHQSDIHRLAQRCELSVAMIAVPLIKTGKATPTLQQLVACLQRSSHRNSPQYVAALHERLLALSKAEIEKVSGAINMACAHLYGMPQAIARNYYLSSMNTPPDRGREHAEVVKAAVYRRLFLRPSGGGDRKMRGRVDRLVEDLARACDKWDPVEWRMVPVSLFNGPLDVVMDLNNALIAYLDEKEWDHEGVWMSPGHF